MDSMMAIEIKQTLEQNFDFFLTVQDIRTLNFAKLIKMSHTKVQKKEELSKVDQDVIELAGLNRLIRIIGEYQVPDVMMNFPTIQMSEKCEIFLLPGIEGCGNIFNPLAHKIEASAMCLQHGMYNIGTSCITISEIADCLFQV